MQASNEVRGKEGRMWQSKRMALVPVFLIVVAALIACRRKSSASASGDIGVPEGDGYMTKFEKCGSDKVPALGQAALKQSLEQQREGFKQAAANASSKAALATQCKQMLDTARTSMSAYGCSF